MILPKTEKVLATILEEMAQPSYKLKRRRFFHGTNKENGEAIIKSGHIKIQDTSSRKGMLTPVDGRAYITPDITYGLTYAVGGLFSSVSGVRGGEGYLFVIKGGELGDVQPDEDNLGELVYNLSRKGLEIDKKWDEKWIRNIKKNYPELASRFLTFAKYNLTDNQLEKIKDGEYSYFASGGKRLLKSMSEEMKLALVEAGMHVSTDKNIKFTEAWKVTNEMMPLLKKNGSNFFQVAERVS